MIHFFPTPLLCLTVFVVVVGLGSQSTAADVLFFPTVLLSVSFPLSVSSCSDCRVGSPMGFNGTAALDGWDVGGVTKGLTATVCCQDDAQAA